MTTTLQSFLRELTFIQISDIKRHAKGLLTALEKSNRKEFLDYTISSWSNFQTTHQRKEMLDYRIEPPEKEAKGHIDNYPIDTW